MGAEVVFFESEIIRDIFDGAVTHEKENSLIADTITKTAENNVNYLAFSGAKVGDFFGASFVVGVKVFFESIPIDSNEAVVVVETPAV